MIAVEVRCPAAMDRCDLRLNSRPSTVHGEVIGGLIGNLSKVSRTGTDNPRWIPATRIREPIQPVQPDRIANESSVLRPIQLRKRFCVTYDADVRAQIRIMRHNRHNVTPDYL